MISFIRQGIAGIVVMQLIRSIAYLCGYPMPVFNMDMFAGALLMLSIVNVCEATK